MGAEGIEKRDNSSKYGYLINLFYIIKKSYIYNFILPVTSLLSNYLIMKTLCSSPSHRTLPLVLEFPLANPQPL